MSVGKSFFAGIILLAISSSAVAQRTKKARPVAEAPAPPAPVFAGPEYVGIVEAVIDGRRIALERGKIEVNGKVNAFGLGGATVYLQVAGQRSPVRLPGGKLIEFVTKVTSQEVDPVSLVQLYVTKTEKKNWRRVKMARANLGGFSDKTSEQAVGLTGQKYGSTFYKLKTLGPLPPGEYLVQVGGGYVGYLFGVD